jgi:hypothetical protein
LHKDYAIDASANGNDIDNRKLRGAESGGIFRERDAGQENDRGSGTMNSEFTAVSDERNGITYRYLNSDPPLGDGSSDLVIGGHSLHLTSYSFPDECECEREGFEAIIGSSAVLMDVLDLIRTVAPRDSTVLIEGETGTGKELIAGAIHARSNRTGRPFVKLNCAAIPLGLLESELFGRDRRHSAGITSETAACTAGGRVRKTRQQSDSAGECARGGANPWEPPESGLREAVRSDLFYCLNVFPISVPPLRDRAEAISLLVTHFVTNTQEQCKSTSRRYRWRQ